MASSYISDPVEVITYQHYPMVLLVGTGVLCSHVIELLLRFVICTTHTSCHVRSSELPAALLSHSLLQQGPNELQWATLVAAETRNLPHSCHSGLHFSAVVMPRTPLCWTLASCTAPTACPAGTFPYGGKDECWLWKKIWSNICCAGLLLVYS